MNSLQAYYAQIKTQQQAKKNKVSNVIIHASTVLPKSKALKTTVIESYRLHHIDGRGHKRRPLVELVIG